ncbi:MAG: N-acetylmuramoyl-L-alanine amidase [Robiginitomaculum sp.]|nr:N-acetylmuramoyl-L-alanine amidase [Robiginitomaculum sp.]
MKINFHKVSGAEYKNSPNKSGRITPKVIVLHYTASFDAGSAINTLCNPSSRASAHVVIDKDGETTQLVPFNFKAWHAGPSEYEGLKGINSHSIGIEIVNPGFLVKTNSGFLDWAGNKVSKLKAGETVISRNRKVGSAEYHWPVYPDKQLQSVKGLVKALLKEYPTIYAVVSHEEIDTRGWKVDPGPAFPMRAFKSLVDTRSSSVLAIFDRFKRFGETTATRLNVRQGPGTGFDVGTVLTKGAIVEIKDIKTMADGIWYQIKSEIADGFVHSAFVTRTM